MCGAQEETVPPSFAYCATNLWASQSNIVAEDGTSLLRCDVITVDGLEAASDSELRTNMRYLQQESARVAPEAFTLLQQALGLTYHPRNVLVDRELDSLLHPTTAYTHDWMHCLFVDGVANLTVYLLLEACITGGMSGVYESFSLSFELAIPRASTCHASGGHFHCRA